MRLSLVCLLLSAASVWADDAACLKCHGDKAELNKALAGKTRDIQPLFLNTDRLKRSVHGTQGCDECHFEYESFPHPKDAETPKCAECHEDSGAHFAKSVHATTRHADATRAADCADCHGVHDVFKPKDRESRLHPLNVVQTCGQCHFDVDPRTASLDDLLGQKYSDDTHAHDILKRGLTVSATCVSCHGGHDIRGKGDPKSRVARIRVHEVCAQCHLGIAEQYARSVHHKEVEDGKQKGATCTDCHAPHSMSAPDGAFRLHSINACGTCHSQRLGTFRTTHHGKLATLGVGGEAADCASCHGAHDILPASDPASRIHPGSQLVETCGKCHEGSHEAFTGFLVHADPHDPEGYPRLQFIYSAMIWLLLGTFLAGGIHASLWLVRSIIAREWLLRRKHRAGGRYVRRWRPFYTVLHVIFMTAFLLLAATGLPLHYAVTPWASALMGTFGGPLAAGWLHRFAAVVLIACTVAYVVNILYRALIARERGLWFGANSMIPRWQDCKDLGANLRWFFGRGPKPTFDRWTYWEKFDFWAVFWGIAIIGGSGVVLWFPVAATRILPGWMVNVATIVHGHEALLAVGFIFTIHVFHANFRPDKFPMDTLFYTGRMPESEFKHERGREYERAVEEGRFEGMVDDEPRPRTMRRAYIVGAIALCVGMGMVVLMIIAALP